MKDFTVVHSKIIFYLLQDGCTFRTQGARKGRKGPRTGPCTACELPLAAKTRLGLARKDTVDALEDPSVHA